MNRFFFKQKTAYEMRISDWSSDVCSSDLPRHRVPRLRRRRVDHGAGHPGRRRVRAVMTSSRYASVVLTGATSGIGEATARALASRATRLTLLGVEPEPAVSDVLAGIRAAGDAEVAYVSADFTRSEEHTYELQSLM